MSGRAARPRRGRATQKCVACALAFALCAGPSAAQEPAAEEVTPPVSLAPLEPIEQIEVVGREVTPGIFEATPVETEVIGVERVRAIPAQTLADAVRNVVGLRTQQRVQGQAAAASIEGMPAEYTKLLVNGEHYNGELGGVADLADVPVTNIEEIRIIRGPQAVRYGSDAGGAVIDVRTQHAPERDGYTAFLDGGAGTDSHGYGAQSSTARFGSLGIGLSTTFEAIDAMSARGTDAVIPAPQGEGRGRWQDVYGVVEWQASERLTLFGNGGWRHQDEKYEGEPEPADPNDVGAVEVVPGELDDSRWLGTGGFRARFNDVVSLDTELFRYSNSIDSTIGRSFLLEEDEWKVDSALNVNPTFFGLEPRFTLGVDWRLPSLNLDEEVFVTSLGDEIGGETVDKSFSTTGLYAIAELDVTQWLTLQLGGREQMHSKFESKFVPQAALLLEPHEMLRLRGSWGESYRIPSLRDLYQPPVAQVGGVYFLAGSPDLETESATGFRAGFEFLPDPRVTVSGTFFYNSIDDFIRSAPAGSIVVARNPQIPLPPTAGPCRVNPDDPRCLPYVDVTSPVFRKTNLDHVRTRGAEVQLVTQPLPEIHFRAGYTYLETFVDSPTLIGLDELPNEPRHTVDLEGAFVLPRVDTELTVRGRWRSPALTERTGTGIATFSTLERSDQSWVLDLRLVQPLFKGIDAYVDVRNLTNEDVVDSYEIRQRTVFVGVRWNFEKDAGGGE